MATRSDSEKIRLIRILKKRAKSSGSNLYKILSRKDELYEKAIKAQRNAGFMTLTCGIVGFLALVIYTIISNINAGINVDIASYIIIAAIYLGIIIPISVKTASLTTTPTVMLVLTIIQLLFMLLAFGGIIPLIAVVYNAIALVRWSTYRNWYDEVSVGFYKGEKPIRKKEKAQKAIKPKDVYDFSVDEERDGDEGRRKPVGLIVSLVLVIILGFGCIGCFYWGRNGGWIDGHATGDNDELADGTWYYYQVGLSGSGKDSVVYWRSDDYYGTFAECKDAFLGSDNEYAPGGCVRDCEIRPWDAYVVRPATCAEVVRIY